MIHPIQMNHLKVEVFVCMLGELLVWYDEQVLHKAGGF